MARGKWKFDIWLFIDICIIAMVLACLIIGYRLLQVETLLPQGAWRAEDSNYYVLFKSNGTYVETKYNIERPYRQVDGGIILYDILGKPQYVDLHANLGKKALVSLNGETHVMVESDRSPQLYQWGNIPTGICTQAFELRQNLDVDCYLRFYDDNVFVSAIGDEKSVGKYAIDDSGDIILFTENGNATDVLKSCNEGFAMGVMLSNVNVGVTMSNALYVNGSILDGQAFDEMTGVTYVFSDDNTALRVQQDNTTLEFLYYVDLDGLITLTDSAGSRTMDYLWLDTETGEIYRYIFLNDKWYDFITGNSNQVA